MLFNSYGFLLLFLPVALAGYYWIGRTSHEGALAWISVVSLAFYGWGAPHYLSLILILITLNYGAALGIQASVNARVRFWITTLGVIANLFVIGYYKYAGLLVLTTNSILGAEFSVPALLLPLGISFYTFQKIAYLVDTYKTGKAETNLIRYSVFVLFFPQLIAGPIVHHKQIIPQLTPSITWRIDWSNISVGATIFTIGLAKKVLLADNVSAYSTIIFRAAADGSALSTAEAWVGAFAWSLQIYFDFSGYSDMAIGLARMFGILLPLNFNSPYKSESITDFWRRWHMTLSQFLRDYLYIPLGGNRRGRLDRYANLMLTMLIGGLWHGAAWTFVIWGGLHGAYLVVNHAFSAIRRRGLLPKLLPSFLARILSCAITYLAVVVAWVFFRADSWGGAWNMINAMTHLNGGILSSKIMPNPVIAYGTIVSLLLIVWFAPNTQQIMQRFRPAFDCKPVGIAGKMQWCPSMASAFVLGILLCACMLFFSSASEFIYFNF